MLKNFFLSLVLFFLISCGGGGWDEFEGALSGKKKASTDEYLIQKKDPLILPPDYEKLPLPDSKKATSKETSRIETILTEDKTFKKNKKSPIEISVEEELRKRN